MGEERIPHLLCFPSDEAADGLAEETGQQGVQGRLLVQEAVEDIPQSLVSPQPVADLGHVRGQQLAGRVRVPAGAEAKPRLRTSGASSGLPKSGRGGTAEAHHPWFEGHVEHGKNTLGQRKGGGTEFWGWGIRRHKCQAWGK